MKNFDITNEFFAPLTQEDKNFAQQVMKYYELPFDDLCGFISSFRNAARHDFQYIFLEVNLNDPIINTPDYKGIKQQIEERLFKLNGKVNEIAITTQRGTVKVSDSDSLIRYFNWSVNSLRKKWEKYLTAMRIVNGDIFYSIDETEGRFHSNLTLPI